MLSVTSDWRPDHQGAEAPDRRARSRRRPRRDDELEHRVAARERALDRGDERDAVGDERGAVVDHRLALDEEAHAGRGADARERRRRGHRVGRADDRAEHERRLPAHPGHDGVGHDGDGGHRHEHEPDRQQRERARPRASSRGDAFQPAACSSGGRKTRKTTSGSSSRSGSAGIRPIAEPADDEHDRVRDVDAARPGGRSTAAAASSRIRNSMSPTAARTLGSRAVPDRLDPRSAPTTTSTAARSAARARHVRRLPVPVLHRRAADPRARARPAGRPPALRVPPLPAARAPPDAERAAEASEAAAAQGAFWPMHDALYALRGRLGLDDVVGARRAARARRRARARRARGRHARRARAGRRRERPATGVTGTPTFFVNGVRHVGAFDAQSLIAALEGASPRSSASSSSLSSPR